MKTSCGAVYLWLDMGFRAGDIVCGAVTEAAERDRRMRIVY